MQLLFTFYRITVILLIGISNMHNFALKVIKKSQQ